MARKTLRITFADDRPSIDVIPTLKDRLQFEETLRKNKHWGSLQDNALKMVPFEAWAAARRTGVLGLSWEDFVKEVSDVEKLEEPTADEVAAPEEVDGLGEGTPTGASITSPSFSATPSA
jgi:hypothetical protein